MGALLGWWTVERARRGYGPPVTGVMANSIVSSQLLGRIAAAEGLGHEETLTGFKWIARVPGLVFGYEEALGYCVDPEGVRDKDGISAALRVVECVATLIAEGRTVDDVLDDLARRFGLHATGQLSVRVDDVAEIAAAMALLRTTPPTELAGRTVGGSTTWSGGTAGCPPPTGSGSPATTCASSCGRPAPSRSSSATWRSSSPCRRATSRLPGRRPSRASHGCAPTWRRPAACPSDTPSGCPLGCRAEAGGPGVDEGTPGAI